MKKISRKEFLTKDVYIMYNSKEEYKSILKFIEDNFESARWNVDGKKPTEFDFNACAEKAYLGFINMTNNKLFDTCYILWDSENKLMLNFSNFVEIVNSFNTELLTGYEKQYITDIIKASRLRVDYVVKKNPESSNDYLCITIDSDGANVLCLYACCTLAGLEYNKKYTLDELGLIEPKKKITLTEFWKSEEYLAIHCDTEEKVKTLFKAFDKLDKKWSSGHSYLDTDFIKSLSKYCYSNHNEFSKYLCYESEGYTIFEFDEVDLEN